MDIGDHAVSVDLLNRESLIGQCSELDPKEVIAKKHYSVELQQDVLRIIMFSVTAQRYLLTSLTMNIPLFPYKLRKLLLNMV